MAALRSNQDVQAVLEMAGVAATADLAVIEGALANSVLQTLGALTLVARERTAGLRSRRLCSLTSECRDAEEMQQFHLSGIAKAIRSFASLLEDDTPPEPLTGLLMESYPDETALGRSQWPCLCWHLVTGADVSSLKTLVGRHPELCQVKDRFGRAPLTYAAGLDTPEPFEVLLRAHPEPLTEPSSLGCLPLHTAGRHSPSLEVVKRVLSAAPQAARHADNEECLPLHAAARRSHRPEVLGILLEAYPEAAVTCDGVGRYPLHHAALASSSVQVIDTLHSQHPEAVR